MTTIRKAVLGVGLSALMLGVSAHATPFLVDVDISAIAAGTEAILAFDLENADPTYSHVSVSGFAADGTLLVCPPDACSFPFNPPAASPDVDPTGADVTGQLPNTVSMSDANSPGATPITYYQNIVLNPLNVTTAHISFTFDLDAGSPGDGFALTLLDAVDGGTLLDNGGGILFLFTLGQGCDTETYSSVATCTAAAAAPEPESLALVLAALLAVAAARRAERARVRRKHRE